MDAIGVATYQCCRYAIAMSIRWAFRKISTILIAVFVALAPVGAQSQTALYKTAIFSLPFELSADGFILINGRVDDIPGVFLFDTGSYLSFLVNRHYVPLEPGTYNRGGTLASGQKLIIESHPGRHTVTLADRIQILAGGDPTSDKPDLTLSEDGEQQQKNINSHLLGTIGWGFMKKYKFEIDYEKRQITFFPLTAAAMPKSRNQKSLVNIGFTPASPIIPFYLVIADRKIPAAIDTGGWDRIALSTETWAFLRKQNAVELGPGAECVSVSKAYYQGHRLRLIDLEHVEKPTEFITLGVRFLSAYRSIWDPVEGIVAFEALATPSSPPAQSCS